VFPLGQLVYVTGIRAAPPGGEDMGEGVGMGDKACQDVELARRKDVSSRVVDVSVGAVEVDALQGHAGRGHPQ
jgi:hypothetical protein